MVVEYVRNVLGFEDADHAESSPDAATLAVTPLSCAVGWGLEGTGLVLPGTRAAELYGGSGERTESYYCSYGVNPEFRPHACGKPCPPLRVGAKYRYPFNWPDGADRLEVGPGFQP